MSGHVLAYHKLQEKESLPVVLLAKQGYGQWEDDVIIILRFGVLQPVVSSKNLSTVTRLQTPATCNMICPNTFEVKENVTQF